VARGADGTSVDEEESVATMPKQAAAPAARRRSRLWLAVVVVVLLAGGGLFASRWLGLGAAPPPAPTTLVRQAGDRLQASRSFQFRYDVDYGNATPASSGLVIQSAHGEFVRPSSLSASIALLTQQGAVSSQVIETGGKTYLQNPLSGTWGTVQGGFDPASIFDPSRGVKRVLGELHGLVAAGESSIDGRPAWHLKATVDGGALALLVGLQPRSTQVPVEMWIAEDTHDLLQVMARGALASDEPQGTVRTLSLSGYDKHYAITPPQAGH
jgi:hypothetical protein